MRLVLFVPFSRRFVALTFALLKVGAVVVLIDPGMGRTNVFDCLREVDPDGFVAVPIVHVARLAKRSLFPRARLNVTVGHRWCWGGRTYEQLRKTCKGSGDITLVRADNPAAIIFTSGSTGPPKGVLYEHGMFDAQIDMIRDHYRIEPGTVDLAAFPLFGLFDACMGVTTVIPDMDPTRPAQADPQRIIQHITDYQVMQSFGSPAFWNRVGRYCVDNGLALPTLKRALSAGAPVSVAIMERMRRVLADEGADLFTPYGATECLPVSSIGAREVLEDTADLTRQGCGTCVGHPFEQVNVRIITISDEPIDTIDEATELPMGHIGEIIVRSPSATREYFRRPDATRLAKIGDGESFWHRMGDVGYLDEQGRLWMCGRKAHIVEPDPTCNGHGCGSMQFSTLHGSHVVHFPQGQMFTVCCEAIYNEHPVVFRSALVGVGAKPWQEPVIIVEPEVGQFPMNEAQVDRLRAELGEVGARSPLTSGVGTILLHQSFPVDTRHNVKINRELLANWATRQLGR